MATRSNKNNSVNDKDLVDWIIREEGFNTKPEDIGDGKMTLGSGLTDPKWHALYKKKGNKWSEEDNRRAVAEEVANRRKWAERTIPNWEALPDSSQKALLSYKYNYDFTPTNSPKLFQALADSNLKEAARQMDATSKDPKFKKGLQERRQREQEWFLSEIEPEPEPFQVVPNIIHEEIPVSTVVSTPYRTAVNNPTIPTTMIPDSNSYITTHRITPSEDRNNRVQEALNGISDYSRLMRNTSIVNNPIPQYSPNTNIKYAEGGYLNSNNNNQPIYKDWNSLSMREKSEYMKAAIRNGITTLSDIKQAYNQFAGGGNKKEISSTTPFWQKPIIPFRQRNEVIITPDSEYNRYLNTLPDNQRFTPNDKYDSYLYWKLNGKPKDFKEAHDKGMFTYDNSDHVYHANSVAWEDEDTGYFMKPKDHDTVKYELDWFNKGLVTEEGGWQRPETLSEWRESKDFRNDYDLLDDSNRPNFYMYKRKKKAEGGNLYKKGGHKDEGYNNFVAYTQQAEGAHWQGQQDKFKREKGKSATQYYWDEAKKRYKDKWDKWTPSQRIAVADTMYNYGYWDGTFDAYKYDMNVKGVDNDAYWKKYGKGHTRRFNERKKMFYGNEVPEMIAAPKDASIRIPSVQEYVESFIPTFMPSNPEAFFTPLESYQRPVVEEVVEQPLVEAANTYSQEALDREQRQRNLNTLNFILGMTSPQGSDNSFANTIGMLTGNMNAYGGHLYGGGGFTSELDWSPESWFSKRVPKFDGSLYDEQEAQRLASHVPEYHNIEQTAKANGTWLKMPDGSIWEGDPRSWVMMQSEAYKKNYSPKPWYTGQAEWPTKFDYGQGVVETNKVTRAPYYDNQMWFSDDKNYGDTFAHYIDNNAKNLLVNPDNPNFIDSNRPTGINFLTAIPKEGNYRYLTAPEEGTHDYWTRLPYILSDNTIKRLDNSEVIIKEDKDGIPNANIRADGKKVLTDDVVNWSKDLGDEGIFMNQINDGPTLTPEGTFETPIINEFISQPGFTKKVKFIEGNTGDFDINNPYKYTYNPNKENIFIDNNYAALGGNLFDNGGNIHIKPSHRGRLTELKKRTGKSEAELYKTGGPAVRKMITFARNARKWKHGLGGNLFDDGGSRNVIWKK